LTLPSSPILPYPKLAMKARVTGNGGGITNELGMSFRICKMESGTVDFTDKDFDKVITNDLTNSPADTCRSGRRRGREPIRRSHSAD
jgi:hypothetical protein